MPYLQHGPFFGPCGRLKFIRQSGIIDERRNHEDKTKVLVCLAAVCVVLSLFFWPEKEPDAYSSATIEAAEEVSRAETEMLAPDERLYGEDGDVRLQDLYNQKPVCLFFWAVWSDDSLKNLALLEEMYQKYGADVTFVAVPTGPDADKGAAYCRKKGYGIPVYGGDGQLFRDYGIADVPQVIFIARGGQMSFPYRGVLTERQMEVELEKIK